ncbi:hypothetical protein C2G38_2037056 [Gigaspora rosea]|uniref:Uncharacterized protein n=1 Tax=Gigaspora rosea TaxID=44941 RepID=A0A397VE66_9GLOM|nr:hypothetical protein C2G38_2037056 [Gigaspora rosea]
MPSHKTASRIPKHKPVIPRLYRNKKGFISSILVRGNVIASFKFNKEDILIKSDKQITASFATVILQCPEEKTDVATFMLETVKYKKFGKNLTKVKAEKGTIESHVHKIREEMKNLNLVFELIH